MTETKQRKTKTKVPNKTTLKKKVVKLKTLKKNAWDAFSKYIRTKGCLKDTGTIYEGYCYTCGKRLPFKELQAGHLIIGRHNAILFDERGVRMQCYHCNVGLKGNILIFNQKMEKEVGKELIAELQELDHHTKEYKNYEYIEMKDEFKRRIESLTI